MLTNIYFWLNKSLVEYLIPLPAKIIAPLGEKFKNNIFSKDRPTTCPPSWKIYPQQSLAVSLSKNYARVYLKCKHDFWNV